jgi:hypothetical protein
MISSFQYVCSPCCEGLESLGGMKPNWYRIGVAERTRWFIIMLCSALLCFPWPKLYPISYMSINKVLSCFW